MIEIITFFIVLAAGLLLSEIFYSIHLPWVVALIVAGIIIGPHGFGWVETVTPTLDFFAQVGLIFLMFMAGLELRLSSLKENRNGIIIVSLLNGLIPFLIGMQIGLAFNYSFSTALLLGTVFISSSIAIVVPALSRNNLLRIKLGKITLGATMIEDILSLILLSVLLQSNVPATLIPLPLFYILLLLALFGIRSLVAKLKKKYPKILLKILKQHQSTDLFQDNLRIVMTVLMGTVIIFELLGLHAIISGFFAGLILSESIQSEKLKEKLRIISYGIFIPMFFVVIGLRTDIGAIFSTPNALLLASVISIGALASKFVSGYLAGLFSRFNNDQSLLIGASTMPQLTTTLAVAFAGLEFGLFDEKLVTSLIVLSLLSSIISPIMISYYSDKLIKNKK